MVTPVGPVGLIEADIPSHLIGIGQRRLKKLGTTLKRTAYGRAAGRFLYGPSYKHPVRAPIFHPGTRGKHAWQHGHERVQRVVIPRMRNPVVAAVTEVYK